MNNPGQSKPWGYVLRYSVYLEGDPPTWVAMARLDEAIEERLADVGRKVDFIGVSVDVVVERPRDQGAT